MNKLFTSKSSAQMYCETSGIKKYKIIETTDAKELLNRDSKTEILNQTKEQKQTNEMDDWENNFIKKFTSERGVVNDRKNVSTKNDEKVHKIEDNIKDIKFEDLSESQKKAYNVMMSGENCFLTGMAGTGKTTLINKFVKDNQDQGKVVVVTASTGIAAENFGGTTIHKFLSLPWNDLRKLIEKDWKEASQKAKSFLRVTDTLIIDEISMIDYVVFEYIVAMLDHSNMNRVKKGVAPTQLIVVGDFLQLPPVVTDRRDICLKYYPNYGEGFCFNSDAWKRMDFKILKLNEVVRQNELGYINALSKLKVGDREIRHVFNERFQPHEKVPSNAIYLYGTNSDANIKNLNELRKIEKQQFCFKNDVTVNPKFKGKINLTFPDTLFVKAGARVMAVTNDLEGNFKNGSLGTVLNVTNETISVAFDNGNNVSVKKADEEHFSFNLNYETLSGKPEIVKEWQYSEHNFPLKLAYAITIHKSQGQTFDNVVIHPTCFASGQLYVALSRCKTFNGIYLLQQINEGDIKISDEVIKFEKENALI